MNSITKSAIKIACVLIVFLPFKFVVMAGHQTSFFQDFVAAMTGYALGYGVVFLLDKGKSSE